VFCVDFIRCSPCSFDHFVAAVEPGRLKLDILGCDRTVRASIAEEKRGSEPLSWDSLEVECSNSCGKKDHPGLLGYSSVINAVDVVVVVVRWKGI
jgi:hypothetical protein